MSVILGIDPGNKGCMAFLDKKMEILDLISLRTETRGVIDTNSLSKFRKLIVRWKPKEAWIEQVSYTTKDSSQSMFLLGKYYGIFMGLLSGLEIPLIEVPPNKWKQKLYVPANKDQSRARASALMPLCASAWSERKHHDIAEAAMIALYGALMDGYVMQKLSLGAVVNIVDVEYV